MGRIDGLILGNMEPLSLFKVTRALKLTSFPEAGPSPGTEDRCSLGLLPSPDTLAPRQPRRHRGWDVWSATGSGHLVRSLTRTVWGVFLSVTISGFRDSRRGLPSVRPPSCGAPFLHLDPWPGSGHLVRSSPRTVWGVVSERHVAESSEGA